MVRIIKHQNNDFIVLTKQNFQGLICSESGCGKTLAIERFMYNMIKEKCLVIVINDQKNLSELAFCQFSEKYMSRFHKQQLNRYKLTPERIPVKIYHPFSFSIPKHKIPEMKICTISIMDLQDSEYLFLLESDVDKTNLDILKNAQAKMKKTDTWYEYADLINQEATKMEKKIGKDTFFLRDNSTFGFKNVASGNIKNIGSLYGTFYRFKQHYFLQSEDHWMNIDWNEFFDNPNEIKFISTRYINDEKIKNFFQLYILNSIVRKRELCKYRILVVMDELKDLSPHTDKRGFKQVLSTQISRHLNTNFRSNNISSISTSQTICGLDKTLLANNVFTFLLIGKIIGSKDKELLREIYQFEKDELQQIHNMPKNRFTSIGLEYGNSESLIVRGGFAAIFPPHVHCEPGYRYDYIFAQEFPDKMINYSDIIKRMQEEMKVKEKQIAEENKTFLHELREKHEEKKTKKTESKAEEKLKNIRQRQKEEIKQRNQRIYEKYLSGMTQANIGKEYGITQNIVSRIIREVAKDGNKKDQNYKNSSNE